MPIYEYKCRKCGIVEVTQRITGKPLSRCPTGKGKVKKLISNTSFQLKGSGWYVTDYARKEKPSAATKEAKAPAAETKGDGKGDGKAAAGSESSSGEKSSTEKSPPKPAASESTTPS